MAPEQVPPIQRQIVRACRHAGKPQHRGQTQIAGVDDRSPGRPHTRPKLSDVGLGHLSTAPDAVMPFPLKIRILEVFQLRR